MTSSPHVIRLDRRLCSEPCADPSCPIHLLPTPDRAPTFDEYRALLYERAAEIEREDATRHGDDEAA